jgi:hypothetical protein
MFELFCFVLALVASNARPEFMRCLALALRFNLFTDLAVS